MTGHRHCLHLLTGILPIHPSSALRIIDSIPPITGFAPNISRSQRTTGGRSLLGGYYLPVRLAGTAFICIVAAFGAAFLVARAVNHETPARAATPAAKVTPVAAVTPRVAPHKVNKELVSQFAPLKASLRPRPKPRPKAKAKAPVSVASVTPATTPQTVTPTTPIEPAPVVSQPAPSTSSSAPSSSGPTSHHKKSGGGSGGSGTTTIGG
jgi:hypothetical protein